MGKRKTSAAEELRVFLEHAQSNVGGYYKHLLSGKCVEFMRPLAGKFMRVRDMRTGYKFNVDHHNLQPLNEMQVIAMQLLDVEDPEDGQ